MPRLGGGCGRITAGAEIEPRIEGIGVMPGRVANLLLQTPEPQLQRFGNRHARSFTDLPQCSFSLVVETHRSYRHAP